MDNCNNCEGDYCNHYTLTVSTEGAVSDLSPVSDCRYGDTVKLEKVDGGSFDVREIAVVGKQGKPKKRLMSTSNIFIHHNTFQSSKTQTLSLKLE